MTILIVYGLSARIRRTGPTTLARWGDRVFRSRIRLSEKTTAWALKRVPSWKRTFRRSRSVMIFPSLVTLYELARPGTIWFVFGSR